VGAGRRLVWRARRKSEIDFWADWLVGARGTEQWSRDREQRLDPTTEIRDPLVRGELERLTSGEVSILDVGAGPLTSLGYRYPARTVTIVPVDPLAADYDRLLAEAGVHPPLRTLGVAGEDLVERFGHGRFDIAYAANSLDHSAEPLAIISNMVSVVRPGGVVLLRHKRNEGQSARYGGLHQWNFDAVGGRLRLWNDSVEIDVGAALGERGALTAQISGAEVVARVVVTSPG
jgi:SAM-dependent methyltransferase